MNKEFQYRILIDEVCKNWKDYDAEKLQAAKRAIIGGLKLKGFPKMRAAKAIENIIDKLMELSKALAVLPQIPEDLTYCNWFTQINHDLTPVVKNYQAIFAQELLDLKTNGKEN